LAQECAPLGGINGSIVDINSSLPLPRFAIVDGIIGMEGNGPLRGKRKPVCWFRQIRRRRCHDDRLMKIEPRKVKYLEMAGEFLGNLGYEQIEQVGEPVERYQQDFRVIEAFADLKKIIG
jgi:hypothetical protein